MGLIKRDQIELGGADGLGEVPIGSVLPYLGSTAPSNFLLCDGSSLLRAGTYANLFAAIGTTYGFVDGTHFNLPDLRGRSPIGAGTGPGLTTRASGASGGEESHQLTIAELPAHTHEIFSPASTALGGGGGSEALNPPTNPMSSTGSDTAHNNMQPFMVPNYIIRT